MDDVFLKLVNLSISASWLILAVLVLRVVLKKAPKWVMPLLWGVVALRLVCLFSIESALSLIPSAETIPSEIVTETREPVLYEQATLDIVTNPTLPSAAEVPVGVSRQQAQVDFNIYSVLWLAGMAALLVHALVSAGKLKRKLATAILLRDNIYESEFVDSPFVFGVVKPNHLSSHAHGRGDGGVCHRARVRAPCPPRPLVEGARLPRARAALVQPAGVGRLHPLLPRHRARVR